MALGQSARSCGKRWWVAGSLIALGALAAAGGPEPAEARTSDNAAAHAGRKAIKPPQPGPVLAVISIAQQRIWVYGSGGLLAQSAVSTGRTGYRTPTGVFSVVQKSRYHRSNIYSNAPMPYMQRITWSGVALHAGVLPGYPASHGCIRLPHHFAVELWGLTRIGARVVVVPSDASVLDVEHARLPVPLFTPLAPDGDMSTISKVAEPAVLETSSIEVAGPAGDAGSETSAPAVKLTSPIERAKAARVRAVADAAAKTKAAKAAVETSAAMAAEANKAIALLRKTEQALAAAVAKRDAAAKASAAAPPARAERAKASLEAAEAGVAEIEKAAEEARAAEASSTPAALAAAKAAWVAEQAKTEAAAVLKATERNTEPLSIFVSRKAKRVYVRQAWVPIHEAPVVFEQPEQLLGTHQYLAVAAQDDGKALRWIAVSIRPSPEAPSARTGARTVPASTASGGAAQLTALAALARFELPEETRRFIEDRLWAGASLIVSDEGISGETSATTDFIVLTR